MHTFHTSAHAHAYTHMQNFSGLRQACFRESDTNTQHNSKPYYTVWMEIGRFHIKSSNKVHTIVEHESHISLRYMVTSMEADSLISIPKTILAGQSSTVLHYIPTLAYLN